MASQLKSGSGAVQRNNYAQERRWEKNRTKRLNRELKARLAQFNDPNHPAVLEITNAIAGIVYRRKTPKTSPWTASRRRQATLFKQFTGRADPDLFSNNPKLEIAALRKSHFGDLILREKVLKLDALKPQAYKTVMQYAIMQAIVG